MCGQKGKIRWQKRCWKESVTFREHTAYLAVVTGQVDGDIDSYSEETRTYQKILGETNQKIGSAADQITEVVYGIPVPVKV